MPEVRATERTSHCRRAALVRKGDGVRRPFIAGAAAIATAEIANLKAQIEAHRGLSTSLAFD